ncbi:flagellar motor protein PomA [Thauera mechernichensis]|uniref:Flagellar motor protein PomA n=1 Tax=Thauera mechernichensis TaxID=82788 RepID=A0ABW3WAW1_9RHOO|nr:MULTISPECIES: flagellar motor protein PomA [Thauera]ENO80770.1 MotA/TolQ/ExbB proton channel [Thauera sp. 27]ENO91654.1 MotA/TolQ/ExbB proton channel [Thauera sp. 28]MDG3064258.1 flagellar motor protein PomA [Thauera mechernichensis]WBL63839.1 flagellar motor protein PomA [Thauera sp. WB-2]HAG74611.1 flagellar motor protein PomA [Thauera sp.]
MDLATLIGLLGSLGIVVSAIVLGASAMIFLNGPSLLIVVGGSLFVVLSKFTLQQFLGAFKVAAKAFKFRLPDTEEVIKEVMEVAQVARKEGMLALESRPSSIPFFQQGIQLMIDGQAPETVREILQKERLLTLERHRWGAKVFSAMGDVGPAMGMIGTLIGLVQMLSNMEDPKSIGPAMAVALLTTLYGAMMATMIFLPMADKLNLRMTEEARLNAMLIDAISAIQNGTNPRVIETLLTSYLPPAKRKSEGG